ncbi:MAG: ribokinase [Holosporales bacterium]
MIIVFGSLNMDMVFLVEEMPTPGETVLCADYSLHPGGKGANQAVAAARDGAHVKMYGCVGLDAFGQNLMDTLSASGVDCTGIARTGRPTACAAICVDAKAENMITVASGANLEAESTSIPDGELGPETTLILQMEVELQQNLALMRRARAHGTRILLNLAPASPLPEEALDLVDILVVNQTEAQQLASAFHIPHTKPREIARHLSAQYGLWCVVTQGDQGAYLSTPEGDWSVAALPIKPCDTTGAGDAFVGVFAASLENNMAPEAALQRAVAASGLACTRQGAITSLETGTEIDAALAQVPQVVAIAS